MTKMIVRNVRSYQEIVGIVTNSVNNYTDPFFPADLKKSIAWTYNHFNTGGFLKVIEKNGEVIAYGAATLMLPTVYSKVQSLTQVVYHTKTKGRDAVMALRLFHQAMVDHAKAKGIRVCTTSSLLDNYEVFYRVLARDGWMPRGCTLVMPIDH